MENKNTLKLTVKKAWLDIIKEGKKVENKDGTDKKIDFIEFSNGYSKDSPKIRRKFLKWDVLENDLYDYSLKNEIVIPRGTIVISFGNEINEPYECDQTTKEIQ